MTSRHLPFVLLALIGFSSPAAAQAVDAERQLREYRENLPYSLALLPPPELAPLEGLLEKLQRWCERAQLEVRKIKQPATAKQSTGVQAVRLQLEIGGTFTSLLRFMNAVERDARLLRFDGFKIHVAKGSALAPDPSVEARLDLTALHYLAPRAKATKPAVELAQLKRRERALLGVLAGKTLWGLKLQGFCQLFAEHPGTWIGGLEVSKGILRLECAQAGSSLRTVARFMRALRADANWMEGFGGLELDEAKTRSLPAGFNYMERTDYVLSLPLMRRTQVRPTGLIKPKGKAEALLLAQLYRAHRKQDWKGVARACEQLKATAGGLKHKDLLVLDGHAKIRLGKLNEAKASLNALLELQEDHVVGTHLLGLLHARLKGPANRERAKDYFLQTARAGGVRRLLSSRSAPAYRRLLGPRFVTRLANAANEFSVSVTGLRNPFKSALKKVKKK